MCKFLVGKDSTERTKRAVPKAKRTWRSYDAHTMHISRPQTRSGSGSGSGSQTTKSWNVQGPRAPRIRVCFIALGVPQARNGRSRMRARKLARLLQFFQRFAVETKDVFEISHCSAKVSVDRAHKTRPRSAIKGVMTRDVDVHVPALMLEKLRVAAIHGVGIAPVTLAARGLWLLARIAQRQPPIHDQDVKNGIEATKVIHVCARFLARAV